MGFFDDLKEVVNDTRKVDVAHLGEQTSGRVDYSTKKIVIDTSLASNIGVTINNPYVISFPFKKISFIDIMRGTSFDPRLDVVCTIVFGKKGDLLTDADTVVMRYGDILEFDEVQKDCFLYFTNSNVRCTLLFSTSLKMKVSNSVIFRPLPTRTLQSTPVICDSARKPLVSSTPELRIVHLYNESATDTVYIGSSSVTTANGFPLLPKTFYTYESSGALFGITINPATVSVRILGLYL